MALSRLVRNFYLVGQHLALNRRLREQRNHRLSLTNAPFDLARPLHAYEQVTINEHAITVQYQFGFEQPQDLLVGFSIALVKNRNFARRCGHRRHSR